MQHPRSRSHSSALMTSLAGLMVLTPGMAQAQLVAPAAHAWSQGRALLHTTQVHVPLRARLGQDLRISDKKEHWPQWEGRIGVLMDRPVNALQNQYVLAQPAPTDLNLRSMHILSDYQLSRGFRATAGLLRGHAEQAWWTGSTQEGGLNLSVQRLDQLRLPEPNTAKDLTYAYIGAGYSAVLGDDDRGNASHFNADIGWTAISERDAMRNRVSATDGLGGSPLSGKLRWSPMIKMSVDYAF